MLTEDERSALLRIARAAVQAQAQGETVHLPPGQGSREASGVFVTIKRRGELRGCLGVLQMRDSLAREVARCARDSASEDPRFPPLQAEELPDITLEISVLGPLEPIEAADQDAIDPGRHGLVVEQAGRRGLLLPQVAAEWGWTREQFLRQTCRKAGLPEDAWQRGATVSRFEAEVFGEGGGTPHADAGE